MSLRKNSIEANVARLSKPTTTVAMKATARILARRSRTNVRRKRHHVHQLEDQQAGEQRRQQIEAQHSQSRAAGDQPCSDDVVAGRRLLDRGVHGI